MAAGFSVSSMAPQKVMLLAAGRGERLRPLTLSTPKPLLSVGGDTLIGWHLRRLAKSGVREVAINVSWLHERFYEMLGDGRRFGLKITYFYEGPEPLETAGAIINALDFFEDKPFGVISADVFSEVLPPSPPPQGVCARLWLVDNPPHHPNGDFGLDGEECRRTGSRCFTFSGIATFRPEALKGLTVQRQPLRPLFERWLGSGRLWGQRHLGYWTDVGTAERLEACHAWCVDHL